MIKPHVTESSQGFVFAGTAMVIAFVLGLMVVYFTSNVEVGSSLASDIYSASQSYWTAISGIEYAVERARNGQSYTGTYDFYNSTCTLSNSHKTHNGSNLPGSQTRIVSLGRHGTTARYLEVITQMHTKKFWPDLSVIETTRPHHTFQILNNFTLNDTIYIGGNVDVARGAHIGNPPNDPTHIYVPAGKHVETHGEGGGGDDDDDDHNEGHNQDPNRRLTWSEYPGGTLSLPDLTFPECDSLIQIAASITSTQGNKIKGNWVVKDQVLDLSAFENNTVFVKGAVYLKGVTITGMNFSSPGIIVATKKIELTRHGNHETVAGDNILLIAGKQVLFKYSTHFGNDYSNVSPDNRPVTVNMAYAQTYQVRIYPNAVVWGQMISPVKVVVKGELHGLVWGKQEMKFQGNQGNHPYIEGAIYTHTMRAPRDKFAVGTLNLNHAIQAYYFGGFKYCPVSGSFAEF